MARDDGTIQEDIAYMRALAHEGRHAPLLTGPFLVAAAVIFGAANLVQWALQSGLVQASPWAPLWLWIAAGAVFGLCLTWLIARDRTRPGSSATVNRATGAAWSTVGLGVFATWSALVAMALKSGDWSSMMAMPSIVAVAYGSAWLVSAAMTGVRWMTVIGLLSYVGAVALGWFVDGPVVYLVFAFMIVAVALVPGVVLMRQEPSGIV